MRQHTAPLRNTYSLTWIIFCAAIMIIAIVSSIVVYIQVSHELMSQLEQHLNWEAKFYREQLDQIFLRAALRLDTLTMSTGAVTGNSELLQNELQLMNNNLPSVIRSWVAYPDGTLIPSPNTRPGHVLQFSWWREYLSGHTPKAFMGYILGRSQAMVGRPFIDTNGMSTLVPLTSIDLYHSKIGHAAGLELDINQALVDNTGVDVDWTSEPVSIYTADGQLLAYPYHYYNGNIQKIKPNNRSPLIQQMITHPDSSFGFKLYQQNHQKIAGVFLHDPSLGMVVVVERPAANVIAPIRRITAGPLIVAVLCLFIATLFAGTLYTNLRRLRTAEQLTRNAELRALQAHINPHFLFNTFDRMVGFAVSSGNTALVQMIRSLSNIFRYATRNPNTVVSLQEELQYLNEYVSLQQIRYGNRFSFEFNVPEPLLAAKVIKFCIQPLVENCFVHSIEKTLDPIKIIVTVTQIQDSLEIRVSDDGPGITPQRLMEVNTTLQDENQSPIHGIANIHWRIRFSYGSNYGVRLEPLQPGLLIRLKIPLQYTDSAGSRNQSKTTKKTKASPPPLFP